MSQQQSRSEQTAANLLVAAHLAQQLRMHTGQVEHLLERFAAGEAVDDTAVEAATVRSSLEAAAEERIRLLGQWDRLPARLDQVAAEAATALRAEAAAVGDVEVLSWTALRALLVPLLARAERLEAAQVAVRQRAQRVPADASSVGWSVTVEVDPAWFELRGALAHQPCPPQSAQSPHEVPLRGPVALIGRSASMVDQQPQIVLDADSSVSRRHAQFVVGGNNLTVVDLSSTNGTYVIAGRAAPDAGTSPLVPGVPCELLDGDRVYLGAWTRLTVRSAPD